MMADEEEFNRLPPIIAARIDRAFDQAIASDEQADDDQPDTPSGGFEAGGFILEDDPAGPSSKSEKCLPMRLAPIALGLLGLEPDDEEVLAVLRNAAGGWGGGNSKDKGVSRRDWRAVCAVLMPTDGLTDQSYANSDPIHQPSEDEDMNQIDEEDVDSEDDYKSESDGDDDEYTGAGSIQKRSTRASKRRKTEGSSSSPEDGETTALSSRQKKEVRRIFALFFPGTSPADIDNKRLKIKDIANAAALLKEKLSADDIVEMLETFSTSPDKSLSLSDFENVMRATKLL